MRELTMLLFATTMLASAADTKPASHAPVTTRNWTYRGSSSAPTNNFQKHAADKKPEKPAVSTTKKETPPPPPPEPERRFLTRLVFR